MGVCRVKCPTRRLPNKKKTPSWTSKAKLPTLAASCHSAEPTARSRLYLHVLDRVNRHPSHAYIAGHAGVIRIVAPMRSEVERNAQTLLPCVKSAITRGRRYRGKGTFDRSISKCCCPFFCRPAGHTAVRVLATGTPGIQSIVGPRADRTCHLAHLQNSTGTSPISAAPYDSPESCVLRPPRVAGPTV